MGKIAIFGQTYKKDHAEFLETLTTILKKLSAEIFINQEYYNGAIERGFSFDTHINTFGTNSGLSNDIKTIISLGGDGTMLRAFDRIKDLDIPMLGINLGRLGFLATVQKTDIEKAVYNLLNDRFSIQERTMLEVISVSKGKHTSIGHALNDITIAKKDTNSMIGVEAFLNDAYLTTYWADGLIVATPTGSTGYSLSCQGPVVMPNTNNFVITPVAPHNLNARPIIISDDTDIKLNVFSREEQFLLSLDSRVHILDLETEILVNKSSYSAKLIELEENIFIHTLRDKLLWGYDKRNQNLQ